MKKFYLLKLVLFLIIVTASAQIDFASPEFPFSEHEKPFHSFHEDEFHPFKDDDFLKGTFSSNEKSTLKSTKQTFKLDSMVRYSFISDTDSILSNKTIYEYDANGNTTLEIGYNWNAANEIWIGSFKIESAYNANGNRILYAYYTWDIGNQVWTNQFKRKYEYEYDVHGNITIHFECNLDHVNEDWVCNLKMEYEYDDHGNLSFAEGYTWDNNSEDWVYNLKMEYEYDAYANITLLITYTWEIENEMWVYNHKRENAYDVHGNRILEISYNWDTGNENWVGSFKYEYEYNANGDRILYAYYTWDNGNEFWTNHFKYKYKYEYDVQGNVTLDILYHWNSVDEIWILGRKDFHYWSRAYHSFFTNIYAIAGRTIEIPVETNELFIEDNIISYQFDFNYDNSKLQYVDYSLTGTLAEYGNIQINPTDNNLSIAWANDNPIIGEGEILKLRFKVIDGGDITPTISNALFNTSPVSVENGIITSLYKYGDIDANDHIQAYDAALALQYSVGLDPIPDIDPLPWESWRITTANVDGEGDVTANDAAEILKYTVGLIDIFPVEDNTKSLKSTTAEVIVTYEDDDLVFTSTGELFGLNVFVESNFGILGEPVVVKSGMLKATNITEDNYAIGLVTAQSPSDNEVFMTIPVSAAEGTSITFDMYVNTESKSITVGIVPTSIEDIRNDNFIIYPNPVRNELNINGVEVNSTISIYDISGKQLLSLPTNSTTQRIDVSTLEEGIYIIKVNNQNSHRVSRFVKK